MQIMLNKPMCYEFRKVYLTAKKKGLLHKQRIKAIEQEHYELTKTLLYQYNKHRSTCASQSLIKKFVKSIDYTIDHGLLYYENTLHTLQHVSITKLYELGRKEIVQRIHSVHNVASDLQSHPLPFSNERYNSILQQQLPAFLIPYEKTQQYFSAYQCLEDFDYPLLDGLALTNHNYNLKGIDFVLEYLERLWLEQSFCLQFKTSEITTFIEQYEIQKDVKVDMLGVNLCELLLTQYVFSMFIAPSSHLLITRNECAYIEQVLDHLQVDEAILNTVFNKAVSNVSLSVQQYIQKYKPVFQGLLQAMIPQHAISAWIIVPQVTSMTDFKLTPPCDPEVFQKLLEDIQQANTVEEKIELIQLTPLGLYDFLDILQNNIFVEDEYPLFFDALDTFQIALLFYIQNQEVFRFHQMPNLSTQELTKLDTDEVWESCLYQYISSQSKEVKKHLQDAFHLIKTIDLSV